MHSQSPFPENSGVIFQNKLPVRALCMSQLVLTSWHWTCCAYEPTQSGVISHVYIWSKMILGSVCVSHNSHLFIILWVSLSLETHVTVTQCSRLCTSAGLSGRTCWPTKHSRRRRRTSSHAWPTSSTPLLRKRRKWVSSRQKSLSPAFGRKMVRTLAWQKYILTIAISSRCSKTLFTIKAKGNHII